jgi:hypothetical protein
MGDIGRIHKIDVIDCADKLSLTMVLFFHIKIDRAGIAQLVEYKLPKLGVAGSSPVARSMMVFRSLFEVRGCLWDDILTLKSG